MAMIWGKGIKGKRDEIRQSRHYNGIDIRAHVRCCLFSSRTPDLVEKRNEEREEMNGQKEEKREMMLREFDEKDDDEENCHFFTIVLPVACHLGPSLAHLSFIFLNYWFLWRGV